MNNQNLSTVWKHSTVKLISETKTPSRIIEPQYSKRHIKRKDAIINTTRYKVASSGEVLAQQQNIRDKIQQFRELTGLPENHFNLYYIHPLQQFLEYTQHCSIGDVDDHLSQSIRALKLRRTLILPFGADAEHINKKKDLWTYAIFVASISHSISSLVSHKVIFTQSHESSMTYKWNPFKQPIKMGLELHSLGQLRISHFADLLFFPLIFQEKSLQWLYSDITVFNTTLELIMRPSKVKGLNHLIAHKPTKKAIPSYKEDSYDLSNSGAPRNEIPEVSTEDDLTQSLEDSEKPTKSEQEIHDSINSPTPQNLPIEGTPTFGTWLLSEIEQGSSSNHICRTYDGYAIANPGIFISYSRVGKRNWKDVQSEFMSQAIHEECPYKVTFSIHSTSHALIIKNLKDLKSH